MAPKAKIVADKKEKSPGLEVYSESSIRNNFSSLEYSRTCQSAGAGMAAGILGLTGIPGFVFYFITVLIQAVVWEYKAGFNMSAYFADRTISFTYSLAGGLFTYVLFWVFLYGVVHVY